MLLKDCKLKSVYKVSAEINTLYIIMVIYRHVFTRIRINLHKFAIANPTLYHSYWTPDIVLAFLN